MARLKATTLFFSTLLFIFLSTNAHAQIGKRIKERIKENTERKVEDKIVNKAGQKTDQALDSLFKTRKRPGRSSKKKSAPENGDNSNTGGTDGEAKSMESSGFDFGGLMNAEHENSYTLNQEFKVEITSKEKKNKKEEVVNMNLFYGENCYMVKMPDENGNDVPMKTLIDFKNNSSIMLNDEDMSGMAISLDFVTDKIDEAVANSQDTTDLDYTFEKTGRTKMIAGYSCEEYRIETDESTMNIWYTDDITIDIHQNMGEYAMFGSFSSQMNKAPSGETMGMMMESHMVEKTGKQGTFDYVVKEVNLVPSTINISDYKMGMGGM